MGFPPASKSLWLCILLTAAMPLLAQRGRAPLPGHTPRAATAANDIGAEDPTVVTHASVLLKPSAAQTADLENLLAAQQDAASPNYQHWLTPEQYAQRFGATDAGIAQVTAWLKSQNLLVESVARGRNRIAFSGTVGDLEKAFAVDIHRFNVDGEIHFSNTADPTVPANLSNLIGSIHGLHDFRLRPPQKALAARPKPLYTSSSGAYHYLAPDDIATLYNIRPLYNAGITGTNQTIVVVGQTQLPLTDIQQYRTYFNLPANDPQVKLVPNTRDPGVSNNDVVEADLDVEWAGAVAKTATIVYVYSYDVTDALQYAIDQNLAPVLSMSYGLCESDTGEGDVLSLRATAQQANVQGITWLTASGDSGANDCYASSPRATGKLSVDAPASIPEVTGVGGATLNEGTGNYWVSANDANHASILSYVPEAVWNDSIADGQPASGGGGASLYFTKPTWQTGTGVPADSARDVPDVSLSASADHDGYLVYSGGSLQIVGGTSAGAPTFAGVIALLNQYLIVNGLQAVSGVGNINPRLYTMAATTPGAFHDITVGDNIVTTCSSRQRGACLTDPVGYKAGVGYDQATGLGSVDVFNLVSNWRIIGGAVVKAPAILSVRSSVVNVDPASSVVLTSTVTGSNGGTPAGSVSFAIGSTALGSATLASGTGTLTVMGSQLPAGSSSVVATYSGDTVFASSTTTIALTVLSNGTLSLTGMASAASFKAAYAPGMIVSLFGTHLSSAPASAPSVPLPLSLGGTTATINGNAVPLYYVSPTQVNLQLPYTLTANTTAILKITNGTESATSQMYIANAAPGIFVDSNNAPAGGTTVSRGGTVTLYITGDGPVSPVPAAGSTPTAGTTPAPTQPVKVTVAGANAVTTFAGVPSWSVGVTQINYIVPVDAPLGAQQVVVSVGGVASTPAIITVIQ